MLGAIIGDIVGSTRERNNVKSEDFELLPEGSRFTDDTVMTLAVARWLMDDPTLSRRGLIGSMQELGCKYLDAGYGYNFKSWLLSRYAPPYYSFGNGSAMRVSPVGLYAKNIEEALLLAQVTAEVSHNHPEGIKGAQAIAACVFMSKDGRSRKEIREYVTRQFGYRLDVSLDDLRDDYQFDVSCQGSVPIAIMAFLQRRSAEECLRLAISMGGDSDTIGCMTCAIAQAQPSAKYAPIHISTEIEERCKSLLTPDLRDIEECFEQFIET